MGFNKKPAVQPISEDKLEQFLQGSKDQQITEEMEEPKKNINVNSKRKHETYTVKPDTGIASMIGRGRVFESNFSRQTVYIHNDLIEKIRAASSGIKGEKTRIINAALEMYFGSRE